MTPAPPFPDEGARFRSRWLVFSYGFELRGRYYLAEGLQGVRLGIAAEYPHSRIEKQPLLIATSSPKAGVEVGGVQQLVRLCEDAQR